MKSLRVLVLVLFSTALLACGGGGNNNNNNNSNGGTNGGANGGTNGGENGGANGGANGGVNGGANGGANGGSNGGTNGGANGGSNGGTNGGTNTPPTITAADKDNVAPCPEQSILTDADELADLKDALINGALAFRDVPFDTEADNFKKKCGFEAFWDPANNIDDVSPADVGIDEVNIAQLLTNGNAGICATDALPTNNVTGFPAAGTYRTEIKVASGPSNWLLRLRSEASGSAAGNEFADESVSVPGDIENNFEYRVNGVITPHDDVFAAVVNALSVDGSAVTLDASKTAGGPVVFSLSIEAICVSKS